ncbi:MAG: class I SAM-dependent methyltransferase [Litoreibacter sp.]
MRPISSNDLTEKNRKVWNEGRYEAWVSTFGSADVEAQKILSNPEHTIRRITPYLGALEAKRICSVQGSHGRVAVALAVSGATVQVIDFSEGNRRFAMELAEAANVSVEYTVCDILEAENLDLPHKFDALVLELGILHYHQDIDRFFTVMRKLVADGGVMFLNEFHPLQRKLYWRDGPMDYFCDVLVEADVPNPDATGPSRGKCQYRFWTLGQILTSVINSGFTIARFDEHPDWNNSEIPGTFSLLAQADR